jgi:hypothetical protein
MPGSKPTPLPAPPDLTQVVQFQETILAELRASREELRAFRREVASVAASMEAVREAVLGHADRLSRIERLMLERPEPKP